MKRKKNKSQIIETEIPIRQPVFRGEVFAAMLDEAFSMVQELNARRQFCNDASAFLKDLGMVSDFEDFRKKRKT